MEGKRREKEEGGRGGEDGRRGRRGEGRGREVGIVAEHFATASLETVHDVILFQGLVGFVQDSAAKLCKSIAGDLMHGK